MLSLSRMFSSDYADGTLEQMMISNQPVVLIVLMKLSLIHIFTTAHDAIPSHQANREFGPVARCGGR